jgi:hypothetical protein
LPVIWTALLRSHRLSSVDLPSLGFQHGPYLAGYPRTWKAGSLTS